MNLYSRFQTLARDLFRFSRSGLTLDPRLETRNGHPSARLKLRQRNAISRIFEHNFHWHVDVDLVDRTADDVAAKTRAIVQVDPRGDVRYVGAKAAERLADHFADDGEGKDFPFATDLNPFKLVAGAIPADRPRAKNPSAAVSALLHHQFAGFGTVPERSVNWGYFGGWFFYCFFFCHGKLLSLFVIVAR